MPVGQKNLPRVPWLSSSTRCSVTLALFVRNSGRGFQKEPCAIDRLPLRERDTGQKNNRPEPRLKETFAIDRNSSQNLEAKTSVHTPEKSARF